MISEVVFDTPLAWRQVKVIEFTEEAISKGMVVGNHYHTAESDRREYFVVTGEKGKALLLFRYRDDLGAVKEVEMVDGDTCLIPPGNSHSFKPLVRGVWLWGFSNIPYDNRHDVPDKLF